MISKERVEMARQEKKSALAKIIIILAAVFSIVMMLSNWIKDVSYFEVLDLIFATVGKSGDAASIGVMILGGVFYAAGVAIILLGVVQVLFTLLNNRRIKRVATLAFALCFLTVIIFAGACSIAVGVGNIFAILTINPFLLVGGSVLGLLGTNLE